MSETLFICQCCGFLATAEIVGVMLVLCPQCGFVHKGKAGEGWAAADELDISYLSPRARAVLAEAIREVPMDRERVQEYAAMLEKAMRP